MRTPTAADIDATLQRRAAMVRVAAGTLVGLDAVLLLLTLGWPNTFHLSRSVVVAIGTPQVALQSVVTALPWERLVDRPAGRWVLRANVVLSTAGLLVASTLTTDIATGLLMLLALLVVYSALVLDLADHVAASTAAVTGAAVVWLTTGAPIADVLVRALVLAATAALAAVGSRLAANALAREQRARRVAEAATGDLAVVARAGQTAHHRTTPEVLRAVTAAGRELGWDMTVIQLVEDGKVVLAATDGFEPDLTGHPDEVVVPISVHVLRTGQPVMAADYPNHPLRDAEVVARGIQTALALPLVHRDRVAGVLAVGSRRRRELDVLARQPVELLAGIAERAVEIARHVEQEAATVTKLRELERIKEDFVATVSHELRTPLAVVSGMAETLVARWDEADEALRRHLAERLHGQTRTLEDVIATLLDVARLDRGDLPTRFEPFDVAATLREVVERCRPLMPEHTIRVDGAVSATVRGDRRLIDRVVENLVTNAHRHTPTGTTVTLSVVPSAGSARVTVVDDGPGMDRETVEHVGRRFGPDAPGEASRARGLGLGLALSHEILQLHGTELQVNSAPGAGTALSFVLQAAEAAAPEVPAPDDVSR